MPNDIFGFVKQEEAAFSLPITVVEGWEWSMKEHIRLTTLYKNSQFSNGNDTKSRDNKPFKNIVRPILNVQYRTEGFDVKDVVLYVDNQDEYFKSFLVKKYHDRWAKKYELDTFIDDVNESKVDYGGALIRDVDKKCPELIPLSSLAFCDQTNILSGPIGIKHFYDPSELQGFESVGWGDPKNGATITIEEAIVLAKSEKIPDAQDGKANRTPGKYIECYEVTGVLPESWLKEKGNPDKYIRQMHILMFYKDAEGKKQGLTLFKGRAADGTFKYFGRDKIHGRALGFGGVEELFDAQVWSNYDEIVMKGLLDAATKVILKTTDKELKGKHPSGLKNMENLSIIDIEEGKDLTQVNTSPINIELFKRAADQWDAHARTLGSANDAVLGENSPSGTPFKSQLLITQQGMGLHEYRRGKYAVFIGTMYTDWVLPHLQKDLVKGVKFLEELSLKELQQVVESVIQAEMNNLIKEKMLNGEEIIPSDMDRVRGELRTQFMKRGSKHFLEMYKDEMKDVPIAVQVSVAGKQKDLDKITDKFVNIVRQIIATPQILDDPRMADLFNQLIEYSGLSPIDFGMMLPKPAPAPALQAAKPAVIPNVNEEIQA